MKVMVIKMGDGGDEDYDEEGRDDDGDDDKDDEDESDEKDGEDEGNSGDDADDDADAASGCRLPSPPLPLQRTKTKNGSHRLRRSAAPT